MQSMHSSAAACKACIAVRQHAGTSMHSSAATSGQQFVMMSACIACSKVRASMHSSAARFVQAYIVVQQCLVSATITGIHRSKHMSSQQHVLIPELQHACISTHWQTSNIWSALPTFASMHAELSPTARWSFCAVCMTDPLVLLFVSCAGQGLMLRLCLSCFVCSIPFSETECCLCRTWLGAKVMPFRIASSCWTSWWTPSTRSRGLPQT